MLTNLSDRLKALTEYVDKNDVVADIGTDHGYIPIWLTTNKACRSVILTDINSGPLEKAQHNIRENLGSAGMDMRQGSGLSVLKPGEADAVIIAGMGGILISRILADDPDVALSARVLVFQPRRDAALLRRELSMSGRFKIFDERVVKEGRKYSEIIAAAPCSGAIDDAYTAKIVEAADIAQTAGFDRKFLYEFPSLYILKGGESLEYLRYRYKGAVNIRESILKNSSSDQAETRLREIEERISTIGKFIQCCENYQLRNL